MKLSTALITLLIAILVLAVSLFFSGQNIQTASDLNETTYWLEGLKADKQKLSKLQIYSPDNKLIIDAKQLSDKWVLNNLADYPIELSKLSSWYETIISAKNIEPKTNRPELFYKLGLQDPSASEETLDQSLKQAGDAKVLLESNPDNFAYLVKLTANQQYNFLLGKPATGSNGQYARMQHSQKTWLLNQSVNMPVSTTDWINTELFDWDKTLVSMISIQLVGQESGYKLMLPDEQKQAISESGKWQLTPVESDDAVNQTTVSDYIELLSDIQFIQPEIASTDLSLQDVSLIVQIAFTDDSLVTLNLLAGEDSYWLRLMAEGSGNIASQVTGLTQWQFELSQSQYEKLNKTRQDFLLQPETQAEQAN